MPRTTSQFTSSTILHQSSPAESTQLMHDSRLPKKLDRTRVRKHPSQSTSKSATQISGSKKKNSSSSINTKSNKISSNSSSSSNNNSSNNNNSRRMQFPGDKSRDRSRDLSPSVNSQSSSATSTATDALHTFVYVKDCHYVWLPAQIQSFNDDHKDDEHDDNDLRAPTTVITRVVLPDDWIKTTELHHHSSITELEFNLTSPKGGGGRGSGGMKKGLASIIGTVPTLSQNRSYKQSNNNEGQKRRIYSYEKCHDEINGKIPKGVVRTVSLKDYPNGELPLQNIERKRRSRSMRSLGPSPTKTSTAGNGEVFGDFHMHSNQLYTRNKTPLNPCPALVNARDMADLSYLHEAAILYNLKLRHANRLPYTRVGDIVVAVNPFLWINGLYSSKKQAIYAQHLVWDVKDEDDLDDIFADTKKSKRYTSGEASADCASTSSNESTLHSLPKDDIETKHQPMAHDSFYSRLGLEPHVYESASLAYRGLASDQQNQTILVSGESGAGKTETVKIVMSNLATIEQTRPFYHDNSSQGDVNEQISVSDNMTGIVQQVLESNPLFEAFGCAKTVRNDNSSRFGRFTQLQFEVEDLYDAVMNSRQSVPECLLVGSYCETYLLEKSRVISHAPGERSYHIFYQLLSAPNDEKEGIWEHLKDATNRSFNYVSASSLSGVEGKLDSDTWRHTKKALKLFGFDGQHLRNLLRALCAVLQLGNITFIPSADNDDGCAISSQSELEKLSHLLGIPVDEIVKALTLRVNKIRGEEVVVKSTPGDAKSGCDALAKTIYSQIFDRLVKQINEHTSVDSEKQHNNRNIGTISLLDIFGFEKFDTNRFEQLCINYANERLQQRYVLDNFKAVKEEYTAEGIEIFDFRSVDNSPVVNLLEGRNCIISSLNEECMRPQGSANSLVYKLKLSHKDCKIFLVDRLQDQSEFGIKHFAGAVTVSLVVFLFCIVKKSYSILDQLLSILLVATEVRCNRFSQGMFRKLVQ